jgi:hypothetical protein
MNYASFAASPVCTVNHVATYAGTVALGELRRCAAKGAARRRREVIA